MKTKMLYFLVLWGLLVLVQISAILIIDFTSFIGTVIITGLGTMLTLYLGLKVERRRVKREEDDKKEAELDRMLSSIVAGTSFTINEAREHMPRYEPLFGQATLFDYDLPTLSNDQISHPELYDYQVLHPSNVIQFPKQPSPSAHFVMDDDSANEVVSLMDRNWEALADSDDTEIVPEPGPDICKHCYRQIKDGKHVEGMYRGKIRCDPEDSLGGYGYNAEVTGSECGPTCIGRK